MKKIFLFASIMFCYFTIFSQETEQEPKQGWAKKGTVSLLFNQSSFSDWVAGGENNIAANIGLNYDFNYAKGNLNWDNKLLASYGLTKSKNNEF